VRFPESLILSLREDLPSHVRSFEIVRVCEIAARILSETRSSGKI